MPKHAGAQLVRETQAAHPGTPLIAISGQFRSGLSTNGATAQSLGVQQVIAKPLTRADSARGGTRYHRRTELSTRAHRMSSPSDSLHLNPGQSGSGVCVMAWSCSAFSLFSPLTARRLTTPGARIAIARGNRPRNRQRGERARRANCVEPASRRSSAARYGALVWQRHPRDPAGATRRSPCDPHGGSAPGAPGHDCRCAGHPASPLARILTARP